MQIPKLNPAIDTGWGKHEDDEGSDVCMRAAGKRHAERTWAERAFSSCLRALVVFSFSVIRSENRAAKPAGVNIAKRRGVYRHCATILYARNYLYEICKAICNEREIPSCSAKQSAKFLRSRSAPHHYSSSFVIRSTFGLRLLLRTIVQLTFHRSYSTYEKTNPLIHLICVLTPLQP